MIQRHFTRNLFIFFSLFLISGIIFFPSFLNLRPFWDDERFIFSNPDVVNAPHFFSFWIHGSAFYKSWPLGYGIFWSLLKFFPGQGFFFYKSLNIIFHGLNACLLYTILGRFNLRPTFLLTLFFIVHPLHVETISWSFQLLSILSLTCFLASLLALMRYCETKDHWSIALAFFLFFCSITIKPMALFGPFLFAIVFQTYSLSLRKYLILTPFFMISLWLGLLNIKGANYYEGLLYNKTSQAPLVQESLSLIQSATAKSHPSTAGQLKVYFDANQATRMSGLESSFLTHKGLSVFKQASWHYLTKLILPFHLRFLYPHDMLPIVWGILIMSSLLLIPFFLYLYTSDKLFILFPGFALIFLAPFLGVSKINFFYWSYVADHYAYGLVLALPFLMAILLKTFTGAYAKKISTAYLLLLALLSINHGITFNNPRSLYPETLKAKPHPIIYSLLFQEHLYAMDIKRAQLTLQEALEKFPQNALLKEDLIRLNILKANYEFNF